MLIYYDIGGLVKKEQILAFSNASYGKSLPLQASSDSMSFTTKVTADTLQGFSLLDAFDYLIKIKTESKSTFESTNLIEGQSPSGKSNLHGVPIDIEALCNIVGGSAFRKHGFSGLNIETQRLVLFHMDALRSDKQILNTVIKLISVDVVNNLSRQKLTPKMIFHDASMLKAAISSNLVFDVATGRNMSDAFILSLALSGAIEQSGFTLTNLIGPSKKGNFANVTFNFDHTGTSMFNGYHYTRHDRQMQDISNKDHTGSKGTFVDPASRGSKFLASARRIEELEGRKSSYWSSPKEMAARSFEGFMEDKLKKTDRTNTYLVGHANNQGQVMPNEKGEWEQVFPYPEGVEREKINKAMEGLFKLIKKEKTLKKAMAMVEGRGLFLFKRVEV